jgi:hypothetical protein
MYSYTPRSVQSRKIQISRAVVDRLALRSLFDAASRLAFRFRHQAGWKLSFLLPLFANDDQGLAAVIRTLRNAAFVNRNRGAF